MNYIDVHCHINQTDYGDVPLFLEKVFACGVRKLIAVGFDGPSSDYCRKIAERYDWVYFAAGVHPTEYAAFRRGDIAVAEDLATHPKCVAVGEIGLDYHYPDTDKGAQTECFLQQIALAEKYGLPVQIHSRDAAEDTVEILKQQKPALRGGFLLHCYSYSPETARIISDLGGYFSFGGVCTYKNSKRARKTIAALPADRILSETDSPYLPPASKYGKFPNTPESIPEIVGHIAALKGLAEEDAADIIWKNACALFKKLK